MIERWPHTPVSVGSIPAEAYVVREIKVFQMSGKAPCNNSVMQSQFAHHVVQDNGEDKRRQRAVSATQLIVL